MDMYRASCAHCRPLTERRRLDAVERDMSFKMHSRPTREINPRKAAWTVTVAQYPGRCMADCGDPIKVGEEIAKTGTAWMHLHCAEDT
jgi:hypothetical protein